MSSGTIELPDSQLGKLCELAEVEGTSVEQLLAVEKLAAMLKGVDYLRGEAALGSRAAFEGVLAKVPNVSPELCDTRD